MFNSQPKLFCSGGGETRSPNTKKDNKQKNTKPQVN